MVFKIIRAGRKIHAVRRGMKNGTEMKKYFEKRQQNPGRHPLHEDIEILSREIEWLRFSEMANLHIESLSEQAPAQEESGEHAESGGGRSKMPPFVSIQDIFLYPELWSGKHVIIEGELEYYHRTKGGESWHVFSDGTGYITAVGRATRASGRGTFFGVPRTTNPGRQVYLEISNFHRNI